MWVWQEAGLGKELFYQSLACLWLPGLGFQLCATTHSFCLRAGIRLQAKYLCSKHFPVLPSSGPVFKFENSS